MKYFPSALLLLFLLTIAIWGFLVRYVDAGYDRFVSLLEMRMQIRPGDTRVMPECGCTIRYAGTSVHGRRYTVVIDRLD